MNGRMLGRLANGNEADTGTLIHALTEKQVPLRPCPLNEFGKIPGMTTTTTVSVCGKRPGRKSVGWDRTESPVTCAKCLTKVARVG